MSWPKSFLVAAPVFLVMVLLVACVAASDQDPTTGPEGSPSPTVAAESDALAELLEVQLEVPQDVPHNQRAGLSLKVRNRHPQAHLALSNARYDLRVLQEGGAEVWRTGQFRTEPALYPTIPPGETLEYRIVWPQLSQGRCTSDLPGQFRSNPAPSGEYEIRVFFLVGYAQLLQDGETLAVVEEGEVSASPARLTVTDEPGDADAPPFPSSVDTNDPLRDHPAQRLSGGTRAPEQVDLGDTAALKIIVGNGHDSTLEVPFRQPMYDFTVSTLDGTEVWRWSDTEDKVDTPAVLRLEPGEWEEFEAVWDLRGRAGAQVSLGWYEVEGWLRLAPEGERAWLRQLMFVGPRPALKDVVRVSLEAPDSVEAGEPVQVRFTVENATDGVVRLYHGADYVTYAVLDESGEQVWPGPQVFPSWGATMELLPGQVRRVGRTWRKEQPIEGDQPWSPEYEPVPPGGYTIVGRFRATVGDSTTEVVGNTEQTQLEPHSLEIRPPEQDNSG